MSYEIVSSSDKAATTKLQTFPRKSISIDYMLLQIGQSFKVPAGDIKLASLKMNVKRFMEKNPLFALTVVNHGEVYEVARIDPNAAQSGDIVGTMQSEHQQTEGAENV